MKKELKAYFGVTKTLFDINGIVLLIAILSLIIVFSVLTPNFLTPTNIRVILETMSILTILAIGEHFLLIAGEIDISFTAVLELSAVSASLISSHSAFHIITVAIVVAVAVGIINGLFTTTIGIPSFLVTLATMVAIQGVVFLISEYQSILLINTAVPKIFYGRIFGSISVSVLWMVISIVVSIFILKFTRFGRWIFATGGNERSARLMGIPTRRVKFILFIFMSICASLAGLIAASRSLSGRPQMGQAYLMPVVASPVLAGALLTGGRGSVIRTALGCLVLTIIVNGVNLLGLEPAYQNIFMGSILVGALSIRSFQGKSIKSIF
jgi:ribose/xylose/arabinose/galactoside ABC-type transport system permease subunit